MGLNISTGNMYPWITHTWNTVKGACPHACTYCYMRRWGNQKPARFDAKELKTDLGQDNFIFVGSSCDIFANKISYDWILQTLDHCLKYSNNRYLFQSKNPIRMLSMTHYEFDAIACATIETNRHFPEIMKDSPLPEMRGWAMAGLDIDKYVTVEPILDFDLTELIDLIKLCNPIQVNIGADSGNNKLPEPSAEKVRALIEALDFTKIVQKKNLKRITG